jgi:hypothetical protein
MPGSSLSAAVGDLSMGVVLLHCALPLLCFDPICVNFRVWGAQANQPLNQKFGVEKEFDPEIMFVDRY